MTPLISCSSSSLVLALSTISQTMTANKPTSGNYSSTLSALVFGLSTLSVVPVTQTTSG